MIKLVLVRHGQSLWNLENKFTGWTDVDLSENGIKEAVEAGKVLKEKGFTFDIAYTSVLKRANRTLDLILNELDEKLINDYIATGSPLDKAGAYGYQDNDHFPLIKKISGSHHNVIGFPTEEIKNDLDKYFL